MWRKSWEAISLAQCKDWKEGPKATKQNYQPDVSCLLIFCNRMWKHKFVVLEKWWPGGENEEGMSWMNSLWRVKKTTNHSDNLYYIKIKLASFFNLLLHQISLMINTNCGVKGSFSALWFMCSYYFFMNHILYLLPVWWPHYDEKT